MNSVEFCKKPTYSEKSARLKFGVFNRIGRYLLYAVIGVEVLVLASKQLFARHDFQSDKGLESAYCVEKLPQKRGLHEIISH
jgi:hypothetical protein